MWTPADRALVGDFGSGQALTDDQFRLLEPLIPPARPGGRPRSTDIRRVLDALFHLVRTGCRWRHLPPLPALARRVWLRAHFSPGRGVGKHPPPARGQAVFADSICNRLAALLACFLAGLVLIIVRRLAGGIGFVVQPRRWVVERPLGWFGRWRRLFKDYEALPEASETMVTLAATRLTLHRLAHPNRRRLPVP